MKRDCNTCVYKEGSCYPSTMIFDKDKTCKSYVPDYEDYIAELEKENAELKADNDARKFAMAMSEKVEKQLREENAELKKAVEHYRKERELFIGELENK